MKITICTITINDWYRESVKYFMKNLQTYCDIHGYKCVIHTENSEDCVYDKKRGIPWYKRPLSERLLKESDYVFWIDADCQILRRDQKIEYFIEKYLSKKDFASYSENPINTGLILVKNTENNFKLLDKIWETTEFYPEYYEQGAVCHLWKTDNDFKDQIEIIPYASDFITYWPDYLPNRSFIIHFPGCCDKFNLMYMSDLYYPDKIDEENDEEYITRMNWLYFISVQDIQKWKNGEYEPRLYSNRVKKIFNV